WTQAGSRLGRSPRMGNAVSGMFSVARQALPPAWLSALALGCFLGVWVESAMVRLRLSAWGSGAGSRPGGAAGRRTGEGGSPRAGRGARSGAQAPAAASNSVARGLATGLCVQRFKVRARIVAVLGNAPGQGVQ